MRLRIAVLVVTLATTAALTATPALGSSWRGALLHEPSVAVGTSGVPWSSVGPGWLLASWDPHPSARHQIAYLELVDPQGDHYILYRIPGGPLTQVVDWSGSGEDVLYLTATGKLITTDLRTGSVVDSFEVPWRSIPPAATFTRPHGVALYVRHGVHGLTRDSLSGTVQVTFPTSISGLGKWDGTWLESPDGTELALGTRLGLAFFENSGHLVERIAVTHATNCFPDRWWSSTVVLAACNVRHPGIPQQWLYLISTTTGAAIRLVRNQPKYDLGDYDAFPVGGHTFVQSQVGCGYPALSEVVGTSEMNVDVPGVGFQAAVVSTTNQSLALQTANSCTGQVVIDWWTPSTNAVMQVIGPPVSGGTVPSVIGYPSPFATGCGAECAFSYG